MGSLIYMYMGTRGQNGAKARVSRVKCAALSEKMYIAVPMYVCFELDTRPRL